MDEHAIIQKLILDGVSEEFLEHYANCVNCRFDYAGFFECTEWIWRHNGGKPPPVKATFDNLMSDLVVKELRKQLIHSMKLEKFFEQPDDQKYVVFKVKKEGDESTGDRAADQE